MNSPLGLSFWCISDQCFSIEGFKILHDGQAKKGNIACWFPAAIIILAEINIDVDERAVGIFYAGGYFCNECFFRVEDDTNTRCYGIGEFTLLKNIQVWAAFKVNCCIQANYFFEAGLTYIYAEAEYIPLPACFEWEIWFAEERAGAVGNTGNEWNIVLRDSAASRQP